MGCHLLEAGSGRTLGIAKQGLPTLRKGLRWSSAFGGVSARRAPLCLSHFWGSRVSQRPSPCLPLRLEVTLVLPTMAPLGWFRGDVGTRRSFISSRGLRKLIPSFRGFLKFETFTCLPQPLPTEASFPDYNAVRSNTTLILVVPFFHKESVCSVAFSVKSSLLPSESLLRSPVFSKQFVPILLLKYLREASHGSARLP